MSRLLLVILFTVLLGTVACGGTARPVGQAGDSAAVPAAQTVAVRVHPGGRLAWERAEYTAPTGDVTFVVSSPPGPSHDFAVEGPGVRLQSEPFAGGSTQQVTLRGLTPGAYQIICSLPGHREAGMVATLRVQ